MDYGPPKKSSRNEKAGMFERMPIRTPQRELKDDRVILVENLAAVESSLEGMLKAVRERNLNNLLPGLLRPAAVALADLLPVDAG